MEGKVLSHPYDDDVAALKMKPIFVTKIEMIRIRKTVEVQS